MVPLYSGAASAKTSVEGNTSVDKSIDPKVFAVALKEVAADDFERFGQAFYAAIEGTDFVPLGGVGDGGADGLHERSVFESRTGSRVLQISKQADTVQKIRNTAKRLKEYGREAKSLTMLTSRYVQNADTLEDRLSDELGIRTRIRDARYLEAHVNHDSATRAAARAYVLPAASFLNTIGASPLITGSPELPTASLCAFVGQEIESRRGQSTLLESVTDSLILWSLNDTDPDQLIFKTRDEILVEIEKTLPAAQKFIRSIFDARLDRLSEKNNTAGRKINRYSKENKYCLPFETRQIVANENAADITLKDEVSRIFANRITEINSTVGQQLVEQAIKVCHRAIENAFEQRGLEVVKFIKDAAGTFKIASIDSMVVRAIELTTDLSGTEVSIVRNISLEVLRQTFYSSEPAERTYLQKLSRTYTLLFIIKNEPLVVEYFQTMTSQFILYVGSDIIVRALSEHYLDEEDQSTCNTLKILNASRSKLVLTEKTLEEVCGNIRKANNTFQAEYAEREKYLDAEAARHIDHILIRAYFYSKSGSPERRPNSWRNYVEQFADFDEITRQGRDSLREYLCKKFNFEFEAREQMLTGIDKDELDELADKIQQVKRYAERDVMLAHNDALQVLRIYSRRRELNDRHGSNPFGFRVWWLTQESKVKRATNDLIKRYNGRFLMSPEFLMSFIDVIPSLDQVRRSFSTVFPTILGVRLSNRMNESDFLKVLREYDKATSVDPARAEVILATLSNRLKGSSRSEYLATTASVAL